MWGVVAQCGCGSSMWGVVAQLVERQTDNLKSWLESHRCRVHLANFIYLTLPASFWKRHGEGKCLTCHAPYLLRRTTIACSLVDECTYYLNKTRPLRKSFAGSIIP